MNFQHLRHFVAVAEELHFGLAAERLGMAQPPLSQSIQRLEASLGCSLFIRGRRPIELTAAGKSLLRNAREILNLIEYTRNSTIAAGQVGLAQITIGFTPNALIEIVPRAILEIEASYKSLDIKLMEGSSEDQIRGLLTGDVDIAFISEPNVEIRGLEIRPVDRSAHIAVVPEHSRLAEKDELVLRDLENEPLILVPEKVRPDYRAALTSAFRNAQVPMRVAHEAVFDHTRLRMVSAGLGVTFIGRRSATQGFPGVAMRPVRDLPTSIAIAQCVVWRTAAPRPARKIFEAIYNSVNRLKPEPAHEPETAEA